MEKTGHLMAWGPPCRAAALAFLSAEAFRHLMGSTVMSLSLSSQPNLPKFGHREPLSVPPCPPWDPLWLGELRTQDTSKRYTVRFLSSWVQIGGTWRGSRSCRYLRFEKPIVKHEYFSDCTVHGVELCCQLQQSWWIELTFPLHVSALSTLFLCPQMNLLWNVLAGLL